MKVCSLQAQLHASTETGASAVRRFNHACTALATSRKRLHNAAASQTATAKLLASAYDELDASKKERALAQTYMERQHAQGKTLSEDFNKLKQTSDTVKLQLAHARKQILNLQEMTPQRAHLSQVILVEPQHESRV